MYKLVDGELVKATPKEVAAYEALQKETLEAATPVPQLISRRQGWQALFLDGSLEKVQELIDGIEDPVEKGMAQIYWDTATDFERRHPMVERIGAGLGKTDKQLDELFQLAITL